VIRQHPTVRELFARRLEREGMMAHEEADNMLKEAFAVLEAAKREADSGIYQIEVEPVDELDGPLAADEKVPPVSSERLIALNEELLTWPKHFTPHPKLARTLQRR